jgi:hypothetical protein
MPALPLPSLPNDQEMQREAIETLVDNLGIAKAAIFLGNFLWQPTDSVRLKDQLFAGETVDSLYEKILEWRSPSTD